MSKKTEEYFIRIQSSLDSLLAQVRDLCAVIEAEEDAGAIINVEYHTVAGGILRTYDSRMSLGDLPGIGDFVTLGNRQYSVTDIFINQRRTHAEIRVGCVLYDGEEIDLLCSAYNTISLRPDSESKRLASQFRHYMDLKGVCRIKKDEENEE